MLPSIVLVWEEVRRNKEASTCPGRSCQVGNVERKVPPWKMARAPRQEGRGRMGRALQGLYSGSFMQVVGDKGSLLFI